MEKIKKDFSFLKIILISIILPFLLIDILYSADNELFCLRNPLIFSQYLVSSTKDKITRLTDLLAQLYLKDRHMLNEMLSSILTEGEIELLLYKIEQRSNCNVDGGKKNQDFYYLEDGHLFRGQIDLDETIRKGNLPDNPVFSRELIDAFAFGGVNNAKWDEWVIFIFPSDDFNRAVNLGKASAGIRVIEDNEYVDPWGPYEAELEGRKYSFRGYIQTSPHYIGRVSIHRATYMLVDTRKANEFKGILNGTRKDPKKLKPHLERFLNSGLKIIPCNPGYNKDARVKLELGYYMNPQIMADNDVYKKVRRRGISYTYHFLGEHHPLRKKELSRIIWWVLHERGMSNIRKKLLNNLDNRNNIGSLLTGAIKPKKDI